MLNNLREAFRERVRGGACQQMLTEAEFWVHDPAAPTEKGSHSAPCGAHSTPQHLVYDLRVMNPSRRAVHLIQTDSCLYLGDDGKRCDCVLLAPDEWSYFVEFKKAADGNEKKADGSDRYGRAADCMRQLESTIKDFAQRGIISSETYVLAYACVGHTRQRPYPGADYNNLSEAFRLRFEGLNLRIKLIVLNEIIVPARSSIV